MKPLKVALMDRFKEGFTEGDNFIFYFKEFFKRGNSVFQLDPYTIDFDNGLGEVYELSLKREFDRNSDKVISDLNSFDIIMDMSDLVNFNFAKNLEKIRALHVNPPVPTYFSADKRSYVKRYPEFIPKTFVSSNIKNLERILFDHFGGEMVIKDPFGYCGVGVERISGNEENYVKKLEKFTRGGKRKVVAQRLMEFFEEGSKRVAVVGIPEKKNSYRIIHSYGRKPSSGGWKDNLAQGGKIVDVKDLREDEKDLCLNVASRSGLYCVGLDIMDDLEENNKKVSKLLETNAVLVTTGNGRYSEKAGEIVDFILEELINES